MKYTWIQLYLKYTHTPENPTRKMYCRLNHTTNFEFRVKPDATQTQVLNPWVLTFLKIFQTL